ncbi:Protein kinase-like domain containing protein, partial [Naviculisporaceae sp. PSN 640]
GKTEKLKRYHSAGNHPVHINDRLGPDKNYRVLNKLGSGSYGIVWLVEDLKDSRCRWKALKINDSREGNDTEVKLQVLFEKKGITGRKALECQVCVPYEMFYINGPNGRHLASVLPILGSPLDKSLKNDRDISARWICHQVILAMQFLHETMHIMHGDFRPENILLQIEGLQELDRSEIMKVYGGDPKVISAEEACRGKPYDKRQCPRYLVLNATLDTKLLAKIVKQKTGKRLTPRRPYVAVTDFGSSFHKSWAGPWRQVIPIIMQDPWCACGGPASFESDIWALGHTIFTLMTEKDPFIRNGYGNNFSQFADYFPGIEEAMGAMPHYAVYQKYRGKYIDAKNIPHAILCQTKGISRKEADLLWGMLTHCFWWEPQGRWKIRKFIDHPWFYEASLNEGKLHDKCHVQ